MNSEPSKGKLLVAMPSLLDPHFRRTVVLLCEQGPEGALGLVINRPTEVEVSTLISDLPGLAPSERVYAGGPVGKNGMLILCRGAAGPSSHEVLDDIFLAKDMEILKTPEALGPKGELRCYVGYAGWSPGQLETEIESGAWRVEEGYADLIFDAEPSLLWPQMIRRIGKEWAVYTTLPADPKMN